MPYDSWDDAERNKAFVDIVSSTDKEVAEEQFRHFLDEGSSNGEIVVNIFTPNVVSELGFFVFASSFGDGYTAMIYDINNLEEVKSGNGVDSCSPEIFKKVNPNEPAFVHFYEDWDGNSTTRHLIIIP